MSAMWIGAVLLPIALLAAVFVISCMESGNNNGPTTQHMYEPAAGVELEKWCYTPKGDDCSWYTRCLARRFISQQSGEETYALGYAAPICEGFTESRDSFSSLGQQWVDTTRACLQKRLAPIISQPADLSDEEIRRKAFDTHVSCYTKPAPGDRAFYELSVLDVTRVAWITRRAFVKNILESVALVFYILKGSIV